VTGLPPLTDAAGRPLDQVSLVGISAYGRHGVFEHERRDGQQFHVDAVLHLDTRPAAATDDLAETVDYGALAVGLADVIRGEPVNLVETLAARLAAICLADPRVSAADVTVHKPHAPVTERFDDVRLTIRRYRDNAADRPPVSPSAEGDQEGTAS
jgi:dihydroneopterin aldolase